MPKLRKAALSCLVICTMKGSLILHLRDFQHTGGSSSPHAPSISRTNQPLTSRSGSVYEKKSKRCGVLSCLIINLIINHIKEEHLMSNVNLSDSEGNYTNEFGDRSDAENRGILFNDQIPGLRQADESDGANKSPPGISIDGATSNILNVASKKLRKRKFGTSNGGKQQKVKIDNKNRFDEFGCKRIKNENTSMEAENELLMSKCALAINDLSRKRQTVEYLKEKCNEETAEIAELSMILINNGNENVIELLERLEQMVSTRAQGRNC